MAHIIVGDWREGDCLCIQTRLSAGTDDNGNPANVEPIARVPLVDLAGLDDAGVTAVLAAALEEAEAPYLPPPAEPPPPDPLTTSIDNALVTLGGLTL